MNNGAFGENFPYSNFHDLNMDWIIKIAKDFLDQYSHLEETLATGLTDLTEKAEELEGLLQEWYDTHSVELQQQIATALANAIQTFNSTATATGQTVLNTIPADYSSLWLAIAEPFSATANYVKGQIVKTTDNDGTGHVWKFNANHPAGQWAGTDATEINLGDSIENIVFGLDNKFNTFNVENLFNTICADYTSETDRGMTFSKLGNGIKISGISTAQAYSDIFYGDTPADIDISKKYYVNGGNDARIHLQIFSLASDGTSASMLFDNYGDGVISFPAYEYSRKLRIRLRVMEVNTNINTVLYPAIRDTMTNKELQTAVTPFSTLQIINPDNFSGNDTTKIQSAFDYFDRDGHGIILIGREYTLTDDVFIKHQTFNTYNNRITVIGIGDNAGFNMGAFSFYGYEEDERNHGGITFKNLHFKGIYKLFDISKLIRISVENCTIELFNYITFGYPYMQSIYFINCLIRGIGTCAFKMRNEENASMYDITIDKCLIEYNNQLIDCYRGYEIRITNNCIEGNTEIPIVIKNHAGKIIIANNYFEHNNDGYIEGTTPGTKTHISLLNVNEKQSVSITDNYFSQDNSEGVIVLPSNNVADKGFIRIETNYFAGENQIAIKATENTIYKDLILTGNNGTIENYNNVFPTTENITLNMTDVMFIRTGNRIEVNANEISLQGLNGWTTIRTAIPTGFRPANNTIFIGYDDITGTPIKCRLTTTGTLEALINNTNTTTVSLHCTYSA